MRRDHLQKLATLVLGAYWLLMFVITHIPIPPIKAPPQSDKLVHFVGYGILMFLFRARQVLHRKKGFTGSVWFAAFVLVLYAVIDELLQGPVNRSPDFNDGVADAIGVLIGATLFYFCWPWFERSLLKSGASEETLSD